MSLSRCLCCCCCCHFLLFGLLTTGEAPLLLCVGLVLGNTMLKLSISLVSPHSHGITEASIGRLDLALYSNSSNCFTAFQSSSSRSFSLNLRYSSLSGLNLSSWECELLTTTMFHFRLFNEKVARMRKGQVLNLETDLFFF